MGSEATLEVSGSGSSLSFMVGGIDLWVNVADAIAPALAPADSVSSGENNLELAGNKQSKAVRAFNFARYYNGVKK